MGNLAVIGGTGFTLIDDLKNLSKRTIDTPYGATSSPLACGELIGNEIIFLARHGCDHTIPPHEINYRANIWALRSIGITHVIAVASVGGIHDDTPPQKIVIPDQIIDYTYSREHTFFEKESDSVTHIDFTQPYCSELRGTLLRASEQLGLHVFPRGTYGVTQGPRLETAAEIHRMEKDGCDVVGMTGMPEASLAKELELCYAACALCVNWAAGRSEDEITMKGIGQSTEEGMVFVKRLLIASVELLKLSRAN